MKGYTIQHSIDLLEKQVEAGGSGGASTAAQVSFDNTGTGLVATNVQGAIEEVETNLNTKGFGTTIVDTDLSSFQAVNDTYPVNFDGLLVLSIQATGNNTRISVQNSDTALFTYTNTTGASGSLTIPAKNGDTLKITSVSNASVAQINKYPLNIPTASTRKTKKK